MGNPKAQRLTKATPGAQRGDFTNFMQSLVRFAWMESREPIRDPQEVFRRFFGGVKISAPLLNYHFEITAPATIGAATPLTSRNLTRLRQTFRNHLEELVEAAHQWPDPNQRRDPLAGIVPDRTLTALNRYLGLGLAPSGFLFAGVLAQDLRGNLYFGLAFAIAGGVLGRMGKCAQCGRPVVHKKTRAKRPRRYFCTDSDRNCKTTFFNKDKPKSYKTAAQARYRQRLSALRSRRQRVKKPQKSAKGEKDS